MGMTFAAPAAPVFLAAGRGRAGPLAQCVESVARAIDPAAVRRLEDRRLGVPPRWPLPFVCPKRVRATSLRCCETCAAPLGVCALRPMSGSAAPCSLSGSTPTATTCRFRSQGVVPSRRVITAAASFPGGSRDWKPWPCWERRTERKRSTGKWRRPISAWRRRPPTRNPTRAWASSPSPSPTGPSCCPTPRSWPIGATTGSSASRARAGTVGEASARRSATAFGLFLGLGSLEILAGGNPVSQKASGCDGAGWDWGRFEGTTVPHLPLKD